MRKVTRAAVEAFLNDEEVYSGNTRVERTDAGTRLTLFGKLIAVKEGERIDITAAGWPTNTTKDRLNGLVSRFGMSIYQSDGTWYLKRSRDAEPEVMNVRHGAWTRIRSYG